MPDPTPDRHVQDAQLVGSCLAGDREAWGELLTRHRPLVMTIARRHGLLGAAAEDLFQSTCVTMLERLDMLRDHQSLAAWIATTATRKCWRAKGRGPVAVPLPEDLPDRVPTPDVAFRLAARDAAVRDAVAGLGEPCRTLLSALFDEEASYDVIAARLGLAIGSIGVYRRRCLDRLRKRLAEEGWMLPEEAS